MLLLLLVAAAPAAVWGPHCIMSYNFLFLFSYCLIAETKETGNSNCLLRSVCACSRRGGIEGPK